MDLTNVIISKLPIKSIGEYLFAMRKGNLMLNQFSRTQLLYGVDAMKYMASCKVAVFGIGGVGGYVVEALARSGIGALDLIDDDKVSMICVRMPSGVPGIKRRKFYVNPDQRHDARGAGTNHQIFSRLWGRLRELHCLLAWRRKPLGHLPGLYRREAGDQGD